MSLQPPCSILAIVGKKIAIGVTSWEEGQGILAARPLKINCCMVLHTCFPVGRYISSTTQNQMTVGFSDLSIILHSLTLQVILVVP